MKYPRHSMYAKRCPSVGVVGVVNVGLQCHRPHLFCLQHGYQLTDSGIPDSVSAHQLLVAGASGHGLCLCCAPGHRGGGLQSEGLMSACCPSTFCVIRFIRTCQNNQDSSRAAHEIPSSQEGKPCGRIEEAEQCTHLLYLDPTSFVPKRTWDMT